MHFRVLALAAAAVFGVVQADNGFLDPPIYPRVCAPVCGPVVTVAQNPPCLGASGAECICKAKDMDKLVPQCVSCTMNQKNSQNGQKSLKNIQKLQKDCGFTATSVTLGAAAPTNMPLLGAGAAALLAGYAAM